MRTMLDIYVFISIRSFIILSNLIMANFMFFVSENIFLIILRRVKERLIIDVLRMHD